MLHKKPEIRIEVTEPEKKKRTQGRNKRMAKKGLNLVDEASIDSEETIEEEQWNSDAETVTTMPKATEAGASASQREEDQGNKSPIPVDVENLSFNVEETFVGSPVQAVRKEKKKKEKD